MTDLGDLSSGNPQPESGEAKCFNCYHAYSRHDEEDCQAPNCRCSGFRSSPTPKQDNPEKCPTCDGQGWFKHDHGNHGLTSCMCQACKGTGLITPKSVELESTPQQPQGESAGEPCACIPTHSVGCPAFRTQPEASTEHVHRWLYLDKCSWCAGCGKTNPDSECCTPDCAACIAWQEARGHGCPKHELENADIPDVQEPVPTQSARALEQILDAHAEYYIRQTVKFFQEKGESPALSKNNEGDLTAKAAIDTYANALANQRAIDEINALYDKSKFLDDADMHQYVDRRLAQLREEAL